jgi:hypothetical protein
MWHLLRNSNQHTRVLYLREIWKADVEDVYSVVHEVSWVVHLLWGNPDQLRQVREQRLLSGD